MRRLARQGWAVIGAYARRVHSESYAPVVIGGLRWQTTSAAAQSAATGAKAADAGRAAGWSPLSAVLFIPSAVCGCLAYWQFERMQWKEDLIRRREGLNEAEPVDLFQLEGPAKEYDKVRMRGRYLHEYSLYVGPRPRSVPGGGIQPGYLVVTPLVGADRKGVAMVNRGWVPASWKAEAQAAAAAKIREREAQQSADPAAAATATPTAATKEASGPAATPASPSQPASSGSSSGWWRWFSRGRGSTVQPAAPARQAPAPAVAPKPEPVVVVGVIQPDEQPSQFMPGNQPDSDEFHFLQREGLADALGLTRNTPLVTAISMDPADALTVQRRSPLDEKRLSALNAELQLGGPTYPAPKHVGDIVRFSTMPSDHRNYALTWLTLCVVLAAMARTAVTRPLRGPRIVEMPGDSAREAWKASQAKV